MGNYEIFYESTNILISLFALGCLLLSVWACVGEEKLLSFAGYFFTACIFDFIACWIEEKSFVAFDNGESIKGYIILELVMLFISMMLMMFSASRFISSSGKAMFPKTLIVGTFLAGIVLIPFTTVVLQDNYLIGQMRLIFPLVSFLYLAIAFTSKLSSTFKSGSLLALFITVFFVIATALKFFGIYAPWYMAPIAYIGYAVSLLMIKSDMLCEKLDISQQQTDKYSLQIQDIIRLSPFPIVVSKFSDGKIILMNNNAAKLFGINMNEFENYRIKDLFADSDNYRQLIENIENKKDVKDFEVLIKTINSDTPFWLTASANIIDYNYDIVLYSAFQDITARKNREAMLQNQATRDPLTSLYNRRYFEEETPKQIVEAKNKNSSYSVLMIDADYFKSINDTYGHKVGDKILIEIASKIESNLRDNDIVARYGGEEFVVFLPDITVEQTLNVANRLRESVASIVVYSEDNKEVRISVSVGISSSVISDNTDMLIKTADEALYKAKQNGRNRVEVFTEDDLALYQQQGSQAVFDEQRNQHPIFSKENNIEISLLDGAETPQDSMPMISEPVVEPVVEYTSEPVAEPVVEPVVEYAPEPVAEPVVEPVVEYAPEPVAEPVVEPVVEYTPEPVAEPVVEKTPVVSETSVQEPINTQE